MKKQTTNLFTLTKLMGLLALLALPTWFLAILKHHMGMTIIALILSCMAGGMAITTVTLLEPVWKPMLKGLTVTLMGLFALACAAALLPVSDMVMAALASVLITAIPATAGCILTILTLGILEHNTHDA